MVADSPEARRTWVEEQVRRFVELRPSYILYAEAVEEILKRAKEGLAPTALVEVRAKSVASFAEKLIRKRYQDPFRQMTDLCGARVITRTRAEAESICLFLESRLFDVDWENSVDTAKRLSPTEFGYRSVHYVVEPKKGAAYDGVEIPSGLPTLKAEIQVRTLTEHAWADFAHDLSYKGAFAIPDTWKRELAALAAELEDIDGGFARVEARLLAYSTTYGRSLSAADATQEFAWIEAVIAQLGPCEATARLAARVGKLAIAREDWQKAIDVMSPYVDRAKAVETFHPLLRDLGVALCKLHKRDRSDPKHKEEFERGQHYLELAIQHEPPDPDAHASLGGSWKDIDDQKAHGFYRQAVEIDPTDPYALGNYLEFELQQDPQRLGLARALVGPAMQRRRDHAAVGIDLPWAWYDLGKFHFLRGEPHEALDAYTRALETSPAPWMIKTSLGLRRFANLSEQLEGHPWLVRLLELGSAVQDPGSEEAKQIVERASRHAPPISGPVVIVAGGTDPSVQDRIASYAGLLREGFRGFRGTVVGGGTTQGVSGLVGDLGAEYHAALHTIGYLPQELPDDATEDGDRKRYRELRRTHGRSFSPMEPLQNWTDLVASGIDPADVRVIGINGGDISAAEYRIALALGATVGIIAESGREAGRIVADEWWTRTGRLLSLPEDAQSIRAFLWPGASALPDEACEAIAAKIHEGYLNDRRSEGFQSDSAMAEWKELRPDLKQSNLAQARHIGEKLRAEGYEVEVAREPSSSPFEFSYEEVERLAEMEHGRWVVEKLLTGWKLGPDRDDKKKTNPYLVAWKDLPEPIRDRDRKTVIRIPEYLMVAGLEIRAKR